MLVKIDHVARIVHLIVDLGGAFSFIQNLRSNCAKCIHNRCGRLSSPGLALLSAEWELAPLYGELCNNFYSFITVRCICRQSASLRVCARGRFGGANTFSLRGAHYDRVNSQLIFVFLSDRLLLLYKFTSHRIAISYSSIV